MTAILHTIGHSNHDLAGFVALLRRHGMELLVDVRSQPYSRWAAHFRKQALASGLAEAGLRYAFLGESLGGRPSGRAFYGDDGRLDPARRIRSAEFQAGLEQLLALARTAPTVIMCAEEDPRRCHRRALITPALTARGVAVTHIRGDGRLQGESDAAALDGQLDLFR